MSRSVTITGTVPGSGKSMVVLGVMELLAQHGRKPAIFRPVVEEAVDSDQLVAMVPNRHGIAFPHESCIGVTYAAARDLISANNTNQSTI